ncbi:MAG TPA: hypothetical protein VF177_19220 [Anaerolineae bacterium]
MKLKDVSAIMRVLDPRYPTNLAIIVLSVVVGAAALLYRLLVVGAGLWDSLLWSLAAGLTVGLTWALSRELDPDHDLSAFVAAVLAIAGLIIFGLPGIVIHFWLLVLARIVIRPVGFTARLLDSLALLILGGWLAWGSNWIVGLMTAVAFLLDARLSNPLRRQLYFAGAALLITIVFVAINGGSRPADNTSFLIVVLLISLLFVWVIVRSGKVEQRTDATRQPMDARRVRAAQLVSLLTALLMAWWYGNAGVVQLIPLWASFLGIALFRIGVRVWR